MGSIRKAALAAATSVMLTTGCTPTPTSTTPEKPTASPTTQTATVSQAAPAPLLDIEHQYNIRLGIYAINIHTGQTLSYRNNEPFAMMSTVKTYAAAALLHKHPLNSGYINKIIRYTEADLIPNSPVTSTRLATGMTAGELCEAAVTKSDNTAANLILKELGGPQAVTTFARDINDMHTRLDRPEPDLNTAIPGDPRDTTTPEAIGEAYRTLLLGNALAKPEKDQLTNWLLTNKTGDERIRAGLPKDWKTADKTGSGDYGSANDIAITWTPNGTPLAIAILTTKGVKGAAYDSKPIAAAAKIAAEALT